MGKIAETHEAKNQIQAIYEDGFAEINGRRYDFGQTNHSRRVQVFSYFTSVQHLLSEGNMAFLNTGEFRKVWEAIENIILLDGVQLAKMPQHWEEYPEDYILLVNTAFGVISYPFLKGAVTN